MKSIFKGALPGFLLGAALLVAGCDINAAKDAFDEFDVIIELEPINTVVGAGIVDARTGNFITSPVTLRFVGDDAGSVIDMYSDPIDEQSVSGGLTSFGIANGVVPSEANPVTFRIVASAPGYQTGSTLVTLTEVGDTEVAVLLSSTNPAQMQPGGGTASAPVQTTGGTVQTTTTVETTSTSSGTTATVTIPAGTQATTSTGAAAQGQLSATVTYYQANATSAVPLPTSSATTVQGATGSTSTASLLTVAAATIRMTDASGAQVTSFSTPIQVTMGLDAPADNPATGQPFAAGDQIEIFHYDDSQGIWVSKGMGTVVAGAGKASSTLEISYSTLVTGRFAAAYSAGTCKITVNLFDNTSGGVVSGSILGGGLSATVGPHAFGPDHSSIRIPDLPNARVAAALYFKANGGSVLTMVHLPADCGSTKSVTLPAPPATIDVRFDIQISSSQYVCPTGALRITGAGVPSLVIKHKLQGTADNTAVTVPGQPTWTTDAQNRITGGSNTVRGLVQGRTYTFFTSINGQRQERDITITGTSHTLDISQDVLDNNLCAQ